VEALGRLLELNHVRYLEEVAAGKKPGGRNLAVYDGPTLEL
jgi:hypothetical protein